VRHPALFFDLSQDHLQLSIDSSHERIDSFPSRMAAFLLCGDRFEFYDVACNFSFPASMQKRLYNQKANRGKRSLNEPLRIEEMFHYLALQQAE